ncbi:protein transport protein Sec24-like CEF isoform X2 [Dioscorea cayenensis subsp. rotundata]|uniref:Protein transport protein Sec24-like CEF isoform X2 n=1 Tax=Dioscorea cayennensis subsp. rotundata TaxID=55577 RepID=A0AB40B914_DIOCR|nr:protein transport protein Sec24-like CEF isoform X2 [Dioscorea cayenensis subsp. rotundata]
MASSQGFPSGPPRPRPGFYPPNPSSNPNPNAPPAPSAGALPDAMRNMQIARPPPSSAAPRGPPPFATSRPGAPPPPPPQTIPNRPPPQQFSQSQPPFSSRPPPSAPITSNGPPPAFPPGAPRFPPASLAQAPLVSAPPTSVRAPPPSVVPQVSQGLAPFPGSPQAVSPLGMPPSSQPFGGTLLTTNQPYGVPTISASSFGAPPIASQSLGAPPSASQPFGAPPSASQPFGAPPSASQPFGAPPIASQPFGALPTASQMYGGSPTAPQPFMGPPQPFSAPPAAIPPFGSQMWQAQSRPGVTPMAGPTQTPPRMFGMPPQAPTQQLPPVPPVMGHSPLAGAQMSTPSKIDPNQIPRPMPSNSVVYFETRQGNQASIPPPASSEFVVRDTGNCSPRLMRCTINQIPCTGDLLATSSMPLALIVQPLALPHPEEEPIQVVDFGESGPLRCSRCKAYINPFMKFVEQGRRFICNLCGFTDETPRDYYCNLGPDGRRRDADERPELCRGTVEFVATKEFMVRDPMPAVFFFLVDVSLNAVQTGATAAACTAINQAIVDLPEGPRTMVGIATFDSAIHFYNLKRDLQQPLMLIVPDVQDVYTPLHTDIIVPISECRQHLEQLLDNIPTMFENNRVAESAFGAAIKAAFLAMKPTGGKLLVFQSVLPSIGIGSLSSREVEGKTNAFSADKEAHKLLQPADKTLKSMAIEFAEFQVCVDVFLTTQSFVDIASISVVSKTTGGQVYYYYPFSALSDSAKLYNDLRWNISRPQGSEAVMRVRCSQGLQVQEYSGNFCKRIPTDIDLPGIDCDKAIMVTFKHDDKFQEGTECGFQCATLYTTVYGQRRIRVMNLSLPCTSMLSSLFRSADLDTQFTCFLKQAAGGVPTDPLPQVREQITNLCINILHSYRKFCATVSSSGQLILPEGLKLLPLYTLALIKSIGLRNDGRLDDRSYWVCRAMVLNISLVIPLVYPRMIAIHDLISKEDEDEDKKSLVLATIPLSCEHVNDDGIYLLENGEDGFIYVGSTVNPDILQQLFGVSTADAIPTQLVLQQYDNPCSKKFNDLVNEIRRQRCSYLRLQLCRKGDPSGMLFFSYMVEDKAAGPGSLSYVEFLVHVHRQIQTKMT